MKKTEATANRITIAVAKMTLQIADRIASGKTTAADVELAGTRLDMSTAEHAMFQTRKSAAIGTKLTQDEAQSIYGYLGESVDTFNRQPIAVKHVLTSVFASLIKP